MPDRGCAMFRGFLALCGAKCPIFGNYLAKCAVLEFISDLYKMEANWEETSKAKCRFERQGRKEEDYGDKADKGQVFAKVPSK